MRPLKTEADGSSRSEWTRGTAQTKLALLGSLALTPGGIDLYSQGLPVTVLEVRDSTGRPWSLSSATMVTLQNGLDPWLLVRVEALSEEASEEVSEPRLLLLSLRDASALPLYSEQSKPEELLSLFSLPGWQISAPESSNTVGNIGSPVLLATDLDGQPGDELVVGERSYQATRNGAEGAVTVLYPATLSAWSDPAEDGTVLALTSLSGRRLVGESDEALGTGLLSLEGLTHGPGLALLAYAQGDGVDTGRAHLLDLAQVSGDCDLKTAPVNFETCKLEDLPDQVVLTGTATYERFGFGATLLHEPGGVTGLAISAPGYDGLSSSDDAPGRVYAFSREQLEDAWAGGGLTLADAAATVTGTPAENLGSALLSVPLAAGGQRLTIGASQWTSGASSRGSVLAWNGLRLAKCRSEVPECHVSSSDLLRVTGDSETDYLGEVLTEGSCWDDRAPDGTLEPDELNEIWLGMSAAYDNEGRVLLVSSDRWAKPSGSTATDSPLLDLRTPSQEQLGRVILEADLNGNGEAEALIVSTGNSSVVPQVAGRLYILWDPAIALADQDGDGRVLAGVSELSIGGQTLQGGDCDDGNPEHTGADKDGDGANDCEDCDDEDASRYPKAPVVPGNDPTDANCDGNNSVTWGFGDEHPPSPDPGGCLSWTTHDPEMPSPTPTSGALVPMLLTLVGVKKRKVSG